MFKVHKTNRAQKQQNKLISETPNFNQVSFDTESLHIHKVWNALPFHIKSKENLQALKEVTKFCRVATFFLILAFSYFMIYQLGLLFF